MSYNKVYHQFRKLCPLLGCDDVDYLASYFEKRSAFISFVKDKENEHTSKLIICTQAMKESYNLYNDVVLMDTTYKTNKYQIPLLVFTGITQQGKNALFGLFLLNDETQESFKWVVSEFLECNQKIPNLIVTDQDHALVKAVSELGCHQLLCEWHLSRNLRKNFGYLSHSNPELYEKILKWPYLDTRVEFQKSYDEFKAYFSSKQTFENL